MRKMNKIGRLLLDSGKIHCRQEVWCVDGIMTALCATDYKNPQKVMVNSMCNCSIKRIGTLREGHDRIQDRVYSPENNCPTLTAHSGGNLEIKVIVASRGRNTENPTGRTTGLHTEQRLGANEKGLCNTLTTVRKDNLVLGQHRIRKLTPEEYFKLMGMTAEDAQKCRNLGVSNSSLYKQAGNGIVTNCVKLIFEHLYKAQVNGDVTCFDEWMNR